MCNTLRTWIQSEVAATKHCKDKNYNSLQFLLTILTLWHDKTNEDYYPIHVAYIALYIVVL